MKDAPTLELPMSLSPSSSFYSPVAARLRVPGLTVTLLRQDAARRLPPHGHPTAYFSFLLSGSYEERLGSRRLHHRVPSVVYHPPALEHRDAYGPEGGRILSIEVDAERLARWGPPGADTHPAHLSRTFRRHLGCSPTAFVQRLRVEHAWTRLVGDEPPPLADLALEAGFSDQPALTRALKRFVGSPPGAFRTAVGVLGAAPAD